MSAKVQTTISPYTQEPLLTRPLLTPTELDTVVANAVKASKGWKRTSVEERVALAEKWIIEFEKQTDLMAEDITLQMGRPISQSKGEIAGTLYRARHLVKIAQDCLKPVPQDTPEGNQMKMVIHKQALGVVGVITPWNFPHLTTVNSVLPAILSGNAVLLKPAPQTPVPAERILAAWNAAGLPANVLQVVHIEWPNVLEKFVTDPRIDFVAFTGSVAGGRAVQEAAAKGKGFKGVALELGGKDPAYVREDADVKWTAENLVDAAMFNSGQSCCSVERIYVHSSIYDEFIKHFVETTKAYKLGDPTKPETNLGPVVSLASAERIRKQVKAAVAAGAELLVGESEFPEAKEGTTVVGPQVLVNVDHSMEVMMEETFGPVAGIMKVENDDEALALMNDSPYGLTASVWTSPTNEESLAVFEHFVEELECGIVYLNRADAVEPALPWTGQKDTGRGISLSTLGFDQLTRAKGVCMKLSQ